MCYVTVTLWRVVSSRTAVESKSLRSCNHRLMFMVFCRCWRKFVYYGFYALYDNICRRLSPVCGAGILLRLTLSPGCDLVQACYLKLKEDFQHKRWVVMWKRPEIEEDNVNIVKVKYDKLCGLYLSRHNMPPPLQVVNWTDLSGWRSPRMSVSK